MKTLIRTLRSVACVALGLVSLALHAAPKPSGPNGGRILKTEPRAEFFVTAERKVRITFLDAQNRAVAPTGQVVTVTAGERAAPVTLKFSPAGDGLVSDAALPAGANVPAVVQIKAGATAKASVDRFNVDLAKCPECSRAEYACVCAH
jgi:hypothetical protein